LAWKSKNIRCIYTYIYTVLANPIHKWCLCTTYCGIPTFLFGACARPGIATGTPTFINVAYAQPTGIPTFINGAYAQPGIANPTDTPTFINGAYAQPTGAPTFINGAYARPGIANPTGTPTFINSAYAQPTGTPTFINGAFKVYRVYI